MNNVIVAVVLGGLFYLGGQYILSSPDREQQAVEAGREITVQGSASISTRPDIGKVTLGTQTEPKSTAEAALEELTGKFNAVVDAVEAVGVEEKDIRTANFSLNPQYDYVDGRQQLRGYAASENIIVTIRDLEKVGDVISEGTAAGANQVGGVSFEIDDDSDIKAQAEEAAIENAREKAERLADALGVSLGSVKAYNTISSPGGPIPFDTAALGRGGAENLEAVKIPVGETETEIQVSVTFELR